MLFWMLLRGPHLGSSGQLFHPAELVVGALAAGCGTWASLLLLPPIPRLRLRPTAGLLIHHLWQALRAGAEVGVWALRRSPPLRPGLLRFKPQLQRGAPSELFTALSCLAPGTLPVETASDGSILYHVLDVERPVRDGLASDEARLKSALDSMHQRPERSQGGSAR